MKHKVNLEDAKVNLIELQILLINGNLDEKYLVTRFIEKLDQTTRYIKNEIVGFGKKKDFLKFLLNDFADFDDYLFSEDEKELTDSECQNKVKQIKCCLLEAFGFYEIVNYVIMDDEVHNILYFEKYNLYLKITGYYSSWEGADYSESEFKQVKPIKIAKIEYQYV